MRLRWPSRTRDIVCQEAVTMINDYLENELARKDRTTLERHLAACPHCTAYLQQMRDTVKLTGRLVPSDLSPELQGEFIEVFKRWQAEQDEGRD